MAALFPEPSTADQLASVDHLRRDALAKLEAANRMHDGRISEHWRQEFDRLTRLRAAVVNGSQLDMLSTSTDHQTGSLL